MRWFRSTDLTKSTSSTEAIDSAQGELVLIRYNTAALSLISNCTSGTLYRDTFSLLIYNFTTDKNGYYWCQIVVNGSSYQPSQYAWFYADDTNSCIRKSHFKPANEAQCAFETANTVYTHKTSLTPSFTAPLASASLIPQVTTSVTRPSLRPTHDGMYVGILTYDYFTLLSSSYNIPLHRGQLNSICHRKP